MDFVDYKVHHVVLSNGTNIIGFLVPKKGVILYPLILERRLPSNQDQTTYKSMLYKLNLMSDDIAVNYNSDHVSTSYVIDGSSLEDYFKLVITHEFDKFTTSEDVNNMDKTLLYDIHKEICNNIANSIKMYNDDADPKKSYSGNTVQ